MATALEIVTVLEIVTPLHIVTLERVKSELRIPATITDHDLIIEGQIQFGSELGIRGNRH